MRELIRNTFHLRVPQQRRIDYLDYIRGSLMILVLLQHANVPGSSYILQFHMPALFSCRDTRSF